MEILKGVLISAGVPVLSITSFFIIVMVVGVITIYFTDIDPDDSESMHHLSTISFLVGGLIWATGLILIVINL